MNDSSRAAPPLRVWDLPTRLFHWALVVSVVGAIAKSGGVEGGSTSGAGSPPMVTF